MKPTLATRYLGIELRNPVIVSANPMTGHLHELLRFEQSGAAAVVLPSLFQEQIEAEATECGSLNRSAAWSEDDTTVYLPALDNYNAGANGYLEHIAAAKKCLSIPVIASLNGRCPGGWVRFARLVQDAGADALELNIYSIATDPNESAAQIEDRHVALVTAVRDKISIPLAVKLGPFFTSLPNMAVRIIAAGAQGLVLFNRFLQPDIDPATLEVSAKLALSQRDELRLPLRWMAILRGQTTASLAGTSGVQTAEDVVKLLLAGADVAMVASILLRKGPEYLSDLLADLNQWFNDQRFSSPDNIRGLASASRLRDPSIYERANYLETVTSFTANR